jgi:tRNA 2-selenouridine synthase
VTIHYHRELSATHCILDVRSPAEFAAGHVPGAVNMPLFSNEERAEVGTLYVQVGREAAIERGLQCVGPKLATLVHEAREHAAGKPIVVYCWRGGMRSQSVAWLLQTAGMDVQTLHRGYKGFRTVVLATLNLPWKLLVLVGPTGSGKTTLLREKAARGEQVLDLESIANHKGSAFGALGEDAQPSTEHAMNMMYDVLTSFDIARTVWVEDESRMIGTVCVPDAIYDAMQQAHYEEVVVSREQRIENLVREYGAFTADELIASFDRIRKKLGGERYAAAVAALRSNDLRAAVDLALAYYDRTYEHCLRLRATNALRTAKTP